MRNAKSLSEVTMKHVHIKRNSCRTGIVIVILFTFYHVNSLALQFSSSPDDVNDGFALSRNASHSDNVINNEKIINAIDTQTKLEIRSMTNTEETSDESENVSKRPSKSQNEIPDWQLVHSSELPFGDYFIDTRIVGAVRYHADYLLEKEYEILRELANIQKDLSQYLAISHPRETIEVFFFQSKDTYKRFLGRELQDAPFDREALYFKQSGPGMVLIYQNPNMMEDLRHEMTHAFLHASLSYIPLWLDEGLAEYFEKPRETRAGTNPYFSSVSRKILFGQVPSLAKLEKMRYFDQLGVNEYCEAWSWVHFMIHHSRETHQMLAGYLRLLAEQEEKTPSLDMYLTKTVPDAKKAYIEHFRNWKNRSNTAHRQSSKESSDSEKKSSESLLSLGWSDSVVR